MCSFSNCKNNAVEKLQTEYDSKEIITSYLCKSHTQIVKHSGCQDVLLITL